MGRVVPRRATRAKTVPYCDCANKPRNDGWTRNPETGEWVHPACGRPSRRVWAINQVRFVAG